MKKAVVLGVVSSVFFATSFVLNRSMNLGGGSFLWSASLRYLFMLPILFLLVAFKKQLGPVWTSIKKQPLEWILWSTVGFGLFYLPLTFASNFGASWLVAGTWEITLVCGVLLTPLFGSKIPLQSLGFSCVILLGIFLLQLSNIEGSFSLGDFLLSFIPVLIAAFSYPLGNRKMMQICGEEISTLQRVYGMTLCSLPFWLIVSGVAWARDGLPSGSQLSQSFIVAVFSGVIATVLFFQATNLVKHNPKQLAAIEATQAGEMVFSVFGSALFLKEALPNWVGVIGIVVVALGMALNSLYSGKEEKAKQTQEVVSVE